MKGYECKMCNTELHYEQIAGHGGFFLGIRTPRYREDGTLYYSVYCPTCKEYSESDK